MKAIRFGAGLLLVVLLLLMSPFAGAAGLLGAAGLRAQHAALGARLASNPFGGPLVLESQESARRIEGDVYAVIDHPFAQVAAVLSDPGQWCDILILHLNTKYCGRAAHDGTTHVLLRVGKKQPQDIDAASLLDFEWHAPVARPDYFGAQMDSPDGPFGTHDYRLVVEAVPLEGGQTFLHMDYAFSYGAASQLAMSLYLGTIARDKVGFSAPKPGESGEDGFVGGMRGVAERNTMRYYLAIDAYLNSLSLPPGQQVEKRLAGWFDATEKYPRQLHELTRDEYLRMKRDEVRRQTAAR
jgi:hypothetical protein